MEPITKEKIKENISDLITTFIMWTIGTIQVGLLLFLGSESKEPEYAFVILLLTIMKLLGRWIVKELFKRG